jgi:5-methylcytosine-specific restriction endonuclease McrA
MGESVDGKPPALALDISYDVDQYGMPILEKPKSFDSVDWESWMKLQPRPGDLDKVVHTSKRIIRVPTIIVCSHFTQMPMREQRPTPSAIRRRDGNRCQYTGEELTNTTFSLDHVVPKSRGGKNTWGNLVAAHRRVNSAKGNQTNAEAGLALLKKPAVPRPVPLCNLFLEVKHPDQRHF